MQISTIGVSALKGGRHRPRDRVVLDMDGPVGDRVFAVVDLESERVIRTVEQPALLGCEARWNDRILSVEIDGGWVSAQVEPGGHRVALDYWGRTATMEVVEGPWAREFSRFLGRRVVLAWSTVRGSVVFGGPVTIATTSSLRRLAEESGTLVDERRFRSTLTIDTGDSAAHVEDAWLGRELEIGTARLRVTSGIPRCAVIDLAPDTGVSGTNLLKTLAGYRLRAGQIEFGVYADVIRPGIVSRGDLARVLPAGA